MRVTALLLVLLALAGCASTPRPTYRDFRPASAAEPAPSLRSVAEEAGWTVTSAEGSATVSTAARKVSQGFFSSTFASIDLVPLSGGTVRVIVQAERRSVLGSRSKVYGLDGDLRQSVLGPITEALRARGLSALDAPRKRDEDATE